VTTGSTPSPGPDDRSGTDRASLPLRDSVGILVFSADGRVFVGRRLRGAVGTWQPPQGGIDPGETPLEAARRELHEETGIRTASLLAEADEWLIYELPDDLEHPPRWAERFRGQRLRWFAFRFDGVDTEVDLATDHPEFSAWRWVPLGELPSLGVAFKRPVYARVAEVFAPLAASLAEAPPGPEAPGPEAS
jgi:putative (di)nucleoside polyphosphate hydrolase